MITESVLHLPTFWLGLLLSVSFFGLSITLLQISNRRLNKQSDAQQLLENVNHLLPQTQCGHCGYAGCKPYAQAIIDGQAINRCPPGGQETADALAQLLNRPKQILDAHYRPATVAFIREAECIGCTKCIQACPVDAILGASKLMHTVIADECTGCDLCVDACPVDCIDMLASSSNIQSIRLIDSTGLNT